MVHECEVDQTLELGYKAFLVSCKFVFMDLTTRDSMDTTAYHASYPITRLVKTTVR